MNPIRFIALLTTFIILRLEVEVAPILLDDQLQLFTAEIDNLIIGRSLPVKIVPVDMFAEDIFPETLFYGSSVVS